MTESILDVAQLLATLGVGLIAWRKVGPSRRQRRREEIAAMAVDYAQQMGGANSDKLRVALEAAARLDAADNGKRDYGDGELRIAIEAVLGRRKAGAS